MNENNNLKDAFNSLTRGTIGCDQVHYQAPEDMRYAFHMAIV